MTRGRIPTLAAALAGLLALGARADDQPGDAAAAPATPTVSATATPEAKANTAAATKAEPAEAAKKALPLWELGLGVAGLRLPHYRGADQARAMLLPAPLFIYRGQIFKADRDGARAVLLDQPGAEVDVSVSASPPTRSRDNRARTGMPDLAATLEVGPNINLTLQRGPGWKLDLRLPVRAAIAVRSHAGLLGWTTTPNLNLDVRDVAGWNLGLLAGPVFNSRALNGYFYDVSTAQALADRPAYRAGGGYAGLTALAALSRRDGDRWAGFFIKADSLHGAAFADSPLVRRKAQWSAGFAVSWVLLRSDTLVQATR